MTGADGRAIDRRALAAALMTVVVWASAFVGIRDRVHRRGDRRAVVATESTPASRGGHGG